MMRGTVFTNKTGAVKTEDHRQLLDGHVMDDLVVGTLHKGRINIAEDPHALGSHAGRQGDGMLLAYAHIKSTSWHLLHHEFQGGAAGHGRSDPEYFRIHLCQLDEGEAEDV